MTLPCLGMGTWRLGARGDTPISVLQRGLDYGLALIDTAESYGKGYSEMLVAEAIRTYPRDSVFIVSKVNQNKTRAEMVDSASKIVQRLGTSMDLCLLHAPPWDGTPLDNRVKALEDIVEKGYSRFVGVSNFNVAQIKFARHCLSKVDVVAVENCLNLNDKHWLYDVVPYTEREGMLFIAHRPIDTGQFVVSKGILVAVAKNYGKTNIQTALNWLICLPSVLPIPKSGNICHLSENVGALGWRLSSHDWTRLEGMNN